MDAILSFFARCLYQPVKKKNTIIHELYESIRDHDLEKLKKLLPLVDIYDIEEASVLYYAKYYKAVEIYEYLFTTLDIDRINTQTGETLWRLPLTITGILDDNEITQILSNTQNINTKNIEGDTVLHSILNLSSHSRKSGEYPMYYDKDEYVNTIKRLIEYGADPYIECNCEGGSISSIDLALNHSTNILEILLNNKIGKYIKINTLNRAIKLIGPDLYDTFELLLPHIEDINELDEHGHSVLWNAKKYIKNGSEIIELLEVHGALPF